MIVLEQFHDGERIVFVVVADPVRNENSAVTIEVLSEVPIATERCYGALTRFAPSVVPEVELAHFKAMVVWIRYGVRPAG